MIDSLLADADKLLPGSNGKQFDTEVAALLLQSTFGQMFLSSHGHKNDTLFMIANGIVAYAIHNSDCAIPSEWLLVHDSDTCSVSDFVQMYGNELLAHAEHQNQGTDRRSFTAWMLILLATKRQSENDAFLYSDARMLRFVLAVFEESNLHSAMHFLRLFTRVILHIEGMTDY